MELALFTARLLLAAVFGMAAVAKVADRDRAHQQVAGFGVPAALAGPIGALLPFVELAAALALLPNETAWYGGLAALALLLLFTAAIGVNLARGRRPECRCFGQIAAKPVGVSTLVRNGALILVAAFVTWPGPQPMPSSGAAPLDPGISLASLAAPLIVVAAAAVWLLYEIVRQLGRIVDRLGALEAALASGTAAGYASGHATAVPALMGQPHTNGVTDPSSSPTPSTPAAPTPLLNGAVPAPSFRLPGLAGESYSLDALCAADLPVLLVFVDPHCGPCGALMPEIGRWQREYADRLTVAVVSRGSPDENRAKTAPHGIGLVLLQQQYEVADLFGSAATPGAVLVGPDGTVRSAAVAGADPIRELVQAAIGQPVAGPTETAHPRPHDHADPHEHGHDHEHEHGHEHDHGDGHQNGTVGLAIGDPAPEIMLPDLRGKPRSLKEYRGSNTLVLFWNPSCGFCQQMLPRLKAWEADPPPGAPKLFVVSAGPAETNRALGFRSRVVLDQTFGAGRAFGANGTPMGVLVDGQGRVASPLAAGAEALFALANAPR